MTGVAIAGFNRPVPIGSNVFAVVAAETAVPIFVSNEIRIRSPIDFYFRKKNLVINYLSHIDSRIRLTRLAYTSRGEFAMPNGTHRAEMR